MNVVVNSAAVFISVRIPVGMKRVIALLFFCTAATMAAEKSVHWSDVGTAIAGKNVIVNVADGKHIKGRGVSIEGDTLVLETQKDGRKSVPRGSIREIKVARKAGFKWRAVGTAAGAGIGLAAAIPVLAETHNEGSSNLDGAAAGLIAGLAILGFFAGWSSDRASDTIHLLPD